MTPQEESERRQTLQAQKLQVLSAPPPTMKSNPSVPSAHVFPLLHYGECLANICSNLKNDASLPANIRAAMDRCQTAWDVARRPATEELRRQELDGSFTLPEAPR